MACPIYFLTVFTVTSNPGCLVSENNYHAIVQTSENFPTPGAPLKISCSFPRLQGSNNIDIYHISNHTAHNVTTERRNTSVTAEIGNIRYNQYGWYCCCNGNCTTGSLGSTFVFVGERPVNNVDMKCLLRNNTVYCTWISAVDCIQWRVLYSSTRSSNTTYDCTSDSTACENCPSSVCYIRSKTSGLSLCRQCIIPLSDRVKVKENYTLQFYGENLWGNTTFEKSIMVHESFVILDPVTNLTTVKTSVDFAIISWIVPTGPKPFDMVLNSTCSVMVLLDKTTVQTLDNVGRTSSNITISLENLLPITKYTVTVKCKLTKARYWSEINSINITTSTDRPLTGPVLDGNSYLIKRNSIFIYFKKMVLQKARGIITGYHVIRRASNGNTSFNFSADSLTVEIPIETGMDIFSFEIYSRTNRGVSLQPSILKVDMSNTEKSQNFSVVAERDRNSNFVWISVFNASHEIWDISAVYWCRGMIDNTGNVICKDDFHYTPYSKKFSKDLAQDGDLAWHYAVAFGNQSGLIWESCVFNCRSCDPTSKPSVQFAKPVQTNQPILYLTLQDEYCEQTEWIPYQYFVTYYPQDDPSAVMNKTVVITPYLRTITLEHILEDKMYQISMQVASRTLIFGEPAIFTISSHNFTKTKPNSYDSSSHIMEISVSLSVSILFVTIMLTVGWCLKHHYKKYDPVIITPKLAATQSQGKDFM